MHAKLQFHSLPFVGKDIVPTDTAKDLGMIWDSNIMHDEHIINTGKYFQKHITGKVNGNLINPINKSINGKTEFFLFMENLV